MPGRAHPAALSGERRHVTSLFYDVVNSTQLLNAMGPEEFGLLQRRIHLAAAAAIAHHGGHHDRMLGDGGCAFFGYPAPEEDAAENAVAAALDLVTRCVALEHATDAGSSISVRVGVATGVVVIAATASAGLPGLDEIIGVAPTLAARLQSEAEPNSVAVADATYQITRLGFEFEPMGERHLKGFAEPVRVWRPIARRVHGDRFSSSRRPDTPLSGRTEELDLCRTRWARARHGQGQVVFLVGEPGIGKSRLVLEQRREVTGSGCDARVFQCQPRGNTRPLHPFLDALRRDIGGLSGSDASANGEPVAAYLEHQGFALADGSAEVIAFLLGSGPDSPHTEAGPAAGPAEEVRQRAIEAAIDLISHWARTRPQLIVLEDLHWADTLTEALLTRLIDTITDWPVLLLVTSRQELPPDLTGDPHVLSLTLKRLGPEAMPRLLESIWHPAPKDLASFVYQKSDGIPLFATELARLLQERFGATPSSERDWERALRASGVATLQDLIATRLAGLGEARRAAQVASVIGREFSYDLLLRLMAIDASPAAPEEALARLVDRGVIRRRHTPEGLVFRFRHVLLHEAAYDSLLKAERRALHAAIADLAAAGAISAPADEIMAWHCQEAGRPLDAAQYAIRAAEACAVRSAVLEADRLLQAAEEQLTLCREGSEADDLRLRLLAARGPVAVALFGKGSAQARAAYEEGVRLCQHRGVADRERWLPLYWGWWFTAPDQVIGRRRSDIILSDLDTANDPEVRLQAFHCAWAANFHAGQHRSCLHCIENGLAHYDPQRAVLSRTRYGGHDAKVCGLAERGLSLWLVNQADEARRSMDEALRWAEAVDHVGSLCHAIDFALMLCRFEERYGDVLDLADRLADIAERHALPGAAAKSRIFRGWAQGAAGDLAPGLRLLKEGLELHLAGGTDEDMPVYAGMAAELLVRLGREAAAAPLLDEAVAQAEGTGNTFWVPELYRVRASLLHGRDPRQARATLVRALELARSQGADMFVRRIAGDFAAIGGPSEPQ